MRRTILMGAIVLGMASCSSQEPSGEVVSDSSERVVWDAARAARDRAKKTGPEPFSVVVALTDSYGNELKEPALDLFWSPDDLAKIQRSQITETQLIDLAHVKIRSPRGVVALHAWCNPSSGPIVTRRLCGAERKRAEDEWVGAPTPRSDG